jgi:hypothetical protein
VRVDVRRPKVEGPSSQIDFGSRSVERLPPPIELWSLKLDLASPPIELG